MDLFITFQFIILALATWRVSHLLTYEDGPFNIFQKLRTFVGISEELDEHDNYSFFAKLLSCLKCNSIWVGAIVWTSYCFFPIITMWITVVLAISAVACILDK